MEVSGIYILICKGKILLSVLMASVECLHLGMQEEDIFERTNGQCHLYTFY